MNSNVAVSACRLARRVASASAPMKLWSTSLITSNFACDLFRLQRFIEHLRLSDRHHFVEVPVYEQRGRIVLVQVSHGTRKLRSRLAIRWRTAEILAYGGIRRLLRRRQTSGALTKSKTPYQVTSPCTQSDCAARGDCGSGARDSTLHEVAARAASCPPAEPPQMTARVGSMPNCALFERSQRIDVFTSWIAAGNCASPLSRYSIDATT